MELQVLRYRLNDAATIGKLGVNGLFQCYTLEDKMREIAGEPVSQWKLQNKTAIPVGTYDVVVDFSERFQRPMPHVLNVPGYTGVRIHPGNTDADTDGCILLGAEIAGPDFISDSRTAFDAFFKLLGAAIQAGEKVTIAISNPPHTIELQ